jgi:peptidoglycan-associated lipoprotein
MKKITTSQLLVGLLISGLIGGCAAKPTPVPPDVMASNLAGSGADSSMTSSGTSSQMSESGVGDSGVMGSNSTGSNSTGSNSKGSGSSSSGTDTAGRFSDIQIQETELFGPGISTEGPASPVMGLNANSGAEGSMSSGSGSESGSGSGSRSGFGSSRSGGIDPYGGFISPDAAKSGDLLAGGGIVGEGSRAGGIGEFGKNLGGLNSGKDGVDIGFGSGPAGSTGSIGGSRDYSGAADGKPYEPLAEVARLKPFEPTESLQDIHFDYDKYDLDAAAKGTLNKNSDWLKQNPSSRVEIQGHCDERGTNNYNLGLGERRAITVKKYLISRGVSKDRLFTISYGEERPFCQDSTEGCWKNNRRGHFLVSN